MNKLGVGVIGCGLISGNHFHALKNLETAELRAVCDIDPEKLEKAMQSQGVAGCLDWHELIARDDLDAVHICVPHYLHAEMSIGALKAGKHVLCEKPMGVSEQEANAMLQAARDSGKNLTICYQNRYNGASARMKKIIESGELGQLKGGCAFMTWNRGEDYYAMGDWRGKWATEGGSVLINQSVHTLDLIRWLAGGLTLKGCTMTAKRLARTIETEDTCDMLLTDARGGRYLFYASVCAADNLPVQIQLIFEQGEVFMRGSRLTIETADQTVTEDYSSGPTVGKAYWGAGHDVLIADYYDRLQRGEKPFITPEDALETTRIMEQAYTFHSENRRRP